MMTISLGTNKKENSIRTEEEIRKEVTAFFKKMSGGDQLLFPDADTSHITADVIIMDGMKFVRKITIEEQKQIIRDPISMMVKASLEIESEKTCSACEGCEHKEECKDIKRKRLAGKMEYKISKTEFYDAEEFTKWLKSDGIKASVIASGPSSITSTDKKLNKAIKATMTRGLNAAYADYIRDTTVSSGSSVH